MSSKGLTQEREQQAVSQIEKLETKRLSFVLYEKQSEMKNEICIFYNVCRVAPVVSFVHVCDTTHTMKAIPESIISR